MNKPDLLTTTTTTMTTTTSTAKPATITINMMMRMVDDGIEMRKKMAQHNSNTGCTLSSITVDGGAYEYFLYFTSINIWRKMFPNIHTEMIYLFTNERNEKKKKNAQRQNEQPDASENGKRKREGESCNKNDSISYSRLSVKLFANANGYIGIGKPIENLHFHWKISKMAPNWISLRWFSLPENEQTSQRSRSRIHLL